MAGVVAREAGRVLIVGPVTSLDGGKTTGGVATHVSELARALHAMGRDVAVFGGNVAPGDVPTETEWGTLYPPARLGIDLALSLAGLSSALRVARAWHTFSAASQRFPDVLSSVVGLSRASAHRPDIVHYHHAELRPFLGRLAGLTAPSIITAHSLSAFRDDTAGVMQHLATENLRLTSGVICVSDDAAQAYRELVPGIEPFVVPNGVDVDAFARAPLELPWNGPRPLVLYLGWLAEYKGVRDLAEAMHRIRDLHPSATLALVGPAIDVTAEVVAAGATLDDDAWTAPGPVGPEDIPGWLHAADVLVLPSRVREGQPRVLIEAMASGTPIVSTTVGGVPDLLADGAYGLLVPASDPVSLAEAISETLDDSEGTAARVDAARCAARDHDTETVTRRVADVYDSVLERVASA